MSLRVYAESYDVACSTGGKMLLTFHGNASMQRGGDGGGGLCVLMRAYSFYGTILDSEPRRDK